jgi:hypothetical protein
MRYLYVKVYCDNVFSFFTLIYRILLIHFVCFLFFAVRPSYYMFFFIFYKNVKIFQNEFNLSSRSSLPFMRLREVSAEEICDSLSKYFHTSSIENAHVLGSVQPGQGEKEAREGSRKGSDEGGVREKEREKEREVERGERREGQWDDMPAGRLVSLLQQAFTYQIFVKSAVIEGTAVSPRTGMGMGMGTGMGMGIVSPTGAGGGREQTNTSLSSSSSIPKGQALSEPSSRNPLPLPLPLSLPPYDTAIASHTHSLSRDGKGNYNAHPKVTRLCVDYKPVSVPSALAAILTIHPITPVTSQKMDQSGGQNQTKNVLKRNLGEIRCFSMLLSGGSSGVSDNRAEENPDGNLKLTAVAGTDRGSLLLWQIPAKLSRAVCCSDSNTDDSRAFDIADERFSSRLIAPSAVLHLRKEDNVRVRRAYRGDDDDSSELFPPKVRDVALSTATGSLSWSHTDNSVTAAVLVAAALSDGTIALVCAGLDGDERSRVQGSKRGDYVGDLDMDGPMRPRGASRAPSRNTINNSTDDDGRRGGRGVAFSQKRSYLETHEVSNATLYFILLFFL